jgi:hypothetical protein
MHQNAFADPTTDPNPDSIIPTSQFFSEGNGGESRKSYHAYPKGYAQLVDSVDEFVMTPMQIDSKFALLLPFLLVSAFSFSCRFPTAWNRNVSYNDPRGFVPGPEGKRVMANAPRTGPDAVYSGHLECPCTDRVIKTIEHTYATQATKICTTKVASAEACFASAQTIGITPSAASLDHIGGDGTCAATLKNPVKTQCAGMTKAAAPAQNTIDDCRAWCCNNTNACSTYIFDTNPMHTGHTPLGCYYSPKACVVMKTPSPGSAWSGASNIAPPKPKPKPTFQNITVQSATMPAGCSFKSKNSSSLLVYWNANNASVSECGALAPGTPVVLSGEATSVISFGLNLALNATNPHPNRQYKETTTGKGVATLTISGPADVWFGVGLGAQAMKDTPNAIIVLGNGTVFEQKLANQGSGSKLATSVTVISNTVVANVRTVVLSRGVVGMTKDHYTFDPSQGTLNFINAIGKTPNFSYHKTRASAQMHLQIEGAPTCICDTGTKGYIQTDMNPNKAEFRKNCLDHSNPQNDGDLKTLKNPTCDLEAYRGGLKCCTSGNILLDKGQNPWEENKLVYYMKWRFWFQDYVPAEPKATPPKAASHQNLVRFFKETEANAGEYDIVKGENNVEKDKTIYQIKAHFHTRDGVAECNPRTSPHCGSKDTHGHDKSGITLIYASCHCHAPSCLKCELWNADTNELICAQRPVYGNNKTATAKDPYNELGYAAIPPCLYSTDEGEFLPKPHFLSYDTNLTSIKWNNNTYDHYGEMAMWQMRGYQSYIVNGTTVALD